jgi:hypothetical protein
MKSPVVKETERVYIDKRTLCPYCDSKLYEDTFMTRYGWEHIYVRDRHHHLTGITIKALPVLLCHKCSYTWLRNQKQEIYI